MKPFTAEEAIFSLKCYAGALLALYVSYRIGLPRPFWSMTTAYIVSQPFAGAVRSKAVYRLIGTFTGCAVVVYLVPLLSNAPVLMTGAMVLWVGVCVYFSVLDRTPRGYLFMLAGYTAAMIGFPSVLAPDAVFDTGLARVEEISLGILCATLVHTLILPRSVAPIVLAGLDRALKDARSWIGDTLLRATDERRRRERRTLANDITQLRVLSTHVPYDTNNIRWTARAVRAIQDSMATLTPLVSAIDDRLIALTPEGEALPHEVADVLTRVDAWFEQGTDASAEDTAALRADIQALAPPLNATTDWRGALLTSLSARLLALMDTYRTCLTLRATIQAGVRGRRRALNEKPLPSARNVFHRDHGIALLSAVAAGIAISAVCTFWIYTGWSNGATAVLMAAVFSSFFASQDNPVPGIVQFLTYTILSMPISGVYLLGIMPAVHSFEMLAMTMFPVCLVLGMFLARPAVFGKAMAMLFGFLGTLALHDTQTADLVSFLDTYTAQVIGVGSAALVAALFRSISVQASARRIQAANWNSLSGYAAAERAPDARSFNARLLDRIGLLQMRLGLTADNEKAAASDALKDLRVGRDIVDLQRIKNDLPAARPAIQTALRGLSVFFHDRPKMAPGEGQTPALLACIDRALASVISIDRDSAERAQAVVALVGIRRGLFPEAQAYVPGGFSVAVSESAA